MKILIFVLMVTSFMTDAFRTEEKGSLLVSITNIKKNGKIKVGLYRNGKDFPDPKDRIERKIMECKDTCLFQFESLPYGEYAIALYQDENDNDKLDKNLFGMPTEPFAFSNNFRPKFGGPDFEDCRFEFREDKQAIEIKMINSFLGGD